MKKLLPILLACTLVFTQVGLVMAQQEKVEAASKAATQASKDYEIAKAYTEYLTKPNDKDTIIKLGKLVLPQGTDLSKLSTNDQMRALLQSDPASQQALLNAKVITAPNQVYGAATPAGENYTKIATSAVNETKKLADQKSAEARYEQRNFNSEKIADQYKGTPNADAAEKIRVVQDLQDYKSLGCGPAASEQRASCKEIRERRGIDEINYQSALSNAVKDVQQIEAKIQKELLNALATQQVKVSDILSFKNPKGESIQTNYVGGQGIIYFVSRMIDVLVIVVSSLAVVTLIIGGYMFMFSGGDEQQRENGKDVLIYTVIGLIFVYASYAIVSLIQGLIY